MPRTRRLLAVLVLIVAVVGGTHLVRSVTAEADVPTTGVARHAGTNGNIPRSELASIGDGYELRTDAAEAFSRLERAAASAGVSWSVNSAYRDYATQVQMVEEFGLLADGGRAAAPGESEHGLGLSVDLTLDWEGVVWMRANAGAHGFAETIADEPWHWTYGP